MKHLETIMEIPLDEFGIHPEALRFQSKVNFDKIELTFKYFGQQQPVFYVTRGNQKLIIDGQIRCLVAKSLNKPTLKGIEVNVPDEEVRDYRIRMNQKVKPSVAETCHNVEHLLNLIGTSQGKKRDLLQLDTIEINKMELKEIPTDIYKLICILLDLDFKSSNLRKLMFVFYAEQESLEAKKMGVIDLIDKGEISIHKAYKLLTSKKEKEAKAEVRRLNTIVGRNTDVWYQLHNKSSMIMDEVPNESCTLCIDSHPYFQLRDYRNQDNLRHGKESTVSDYVKNFVAFCKEKREKLKPGGVLVTIIGETYRDGYKGICSKVEVALEEDGWELLDVNIWEKSNGKYTPHPLRFVNSYERIIVAKKPGGETYFEEVMRKSSVNDYSIKKTSNGGVYIAAPESCITNVIKSSTHNPVEFKDVDDQFEHDAPCPVEIYKKFISAYSKPGDTIIDSFIGSGTCGIGLTMGRNVIGYDVDPKSIEFSQKRFDKFIEEKDSQLQLAA